jgi:hypothetical protein
MQIEGRAGLHPGRPRWFRVPAGYPGIGEVARYSYRSASATGTREAERAGISVISALAR